MEPFTVLACTCTAPNTCRIDIPAAWRVFPEVSVECLRPYLRRPDHLGGAVGDGALHPADVGAALRGGFAARRRFLRICWIYTSNCNSLRAILVLDGFKFLVTRAVALQVTIMMSAQAVSLNRLRNSPDSEQVFAQSCCCGSDARTESSTARFWFDRRTVTRRT
jgi:hypothetical protein